VTTILLVTRACHRAAQWHAGQRRKGVAAEPYVNHLAEVAALVAEATGGSDPNLIAAAMLHDAIEDAGVTHAEIADHFNPDVADLVAEVTDDKALDKHVRKALQVEMAPKKSDRAKAIKLADKTSNLRALAASPPVDWDVASKAAYLDWARRVVAGLRGTNAWLEAEFDAAAAEVERVLEAELRDD